MSIDDKIAQNKKDVERLQEEGQKLKEEKKQAEMSKLGDMLLYGEAKRVVLYGQNGKLQVYEIAGGCLSTTSDYPDHQRYTRTGRNIAEFLKTTT